jgi:spore germination protein GerM
MRVAGRAALRSRRVDLGTAATALVVAGSLTACGIPADSQPQALARKDIPFDLLAPSTTTAQPGTPGARVPINVYLVGITGLVPVSRDVRAPATITEALNALLAGPTDAEVANGLRTSVSAQTSLSAGVVGFGVGTVDLGGAFGQVGGQEQILAVAQLVFTATSVPGIVKVQFTLGGRPVEVPAGDGTLTQGPLGRSDFPSLGG